ncbi:hypothetical protein HY468_01700, partial [Candidatus Roizmanbacteria bacterium]|nr:hypothetical protein [Candidatus Roizmanbacteria bacterium]
IVHSATPAKVPVLYPEGKNHAMKAKDKFIMKIFSYVFFSVLRFFGERTAARKTEETLTDSERKWLKP